MHNDSKAENSIVKKYRKSVWIPFVKAVKKYRLIEENDKIAVCISGGKDSMLMAKCMQRLQKFSDFNFSVEYIIMDPGYNDENRRLIESNAKKLDIQVKIFNTNIFNIVAKEEKSPCYLCARMRRGYLYSNAKTLGCNKIALGHHFDDVIETILMSMFYGAEIRTMMPKLHSENFPGMELIRPMYMVHESDIIAWAKYNGFRFIRCACRFTENNADDSGGGHKRQEMKSLIRNLRQVNPNIDRNIFTSVHNVNLDTVIGFRRGNEMHSFLDGYKDCDGGILPPGGHT